MKFTKEIVFVLCDSIAPKYGFEPSLIKALCLQESGKNKDGTFAPDVARLEQGYYRRYVSDKNELATTSEILLAASYGVTQMMGLSLKEIGFFDWYYLQATGSKQMFLGSPFSQFNIVAAIDEYCTNAQWQIEWGCKWLNEKRKLAKGDIIKMLSLWNGDQSQEHKYANEVLTKQKSIGV